MQLHGPTPGEGGGGVTTAYLNQAFPLVAALYVALNVVYYIVFSYGPGRNEARHLLSTVICALMTTAAIVFVIILGNLPLR